jgi:hypothetical protein
MFVAKGEHPAPQTEEGADRFHRKAVFIVAVPPAGPEADQVAARTRSMSVTAF